MSKNMLGMIPLSVAQGPRNDLEAKLAGNDGHVWLERLKKMLRREKISQEIDPILETIHTQGLVSWNFGSVDDFLKKAKSRTNDVWIPKACPSFRAVNWKHSKMDSPPATLQISKIHYKTDGYLDLAHELSESRQGNYQIGLCHVFAAMRVLPEALERLYGYEDHRWYHFIAFVDALVKCGRINIWTTVVVNFNYDCSKRLWSLRAEQLGTHGTQGQYNHTYVVSY